MDSGSVVNTVMATASSPQNTNDVTDRSDNGDDSDGETQDDKTVVVLSRPKFATRGNQDSISNR